ncbi:hypothetical protein [Pseudomonas sp. microsymbiont 2]
MGHGQPADLHSSELLFLLCSDHFQLQGGRARDERRPASGFSRTVAVVIALIEISIGLERRGQQTTINRHIIPFWNDIFRRFGGVLSALYSAMFACCPYF